MAGSAGDGEFGFQIAPMLDILFVLLLFFMVSAGAQKHEAALTTQLPGGQPGSGSSVPVEVGIDADGQVNCGGRTLRYADGPCVAAIGGASQGRGKRQRDAARRYHSHRSTTKHQRVVDVFNACAAAEGQESGFWRRPPSKFISNRHGQTNISSRQAGDSSQAEALDGAHFPLGLFLWRRAVAS